MMVLMIFDVSNVNHTTRCEFLFLFLFFSFWRCVDVVDRGYIRFDKLFPHSHGTDLSGHFNICRCYCILHEENVLGAIFSIWRELRTAKSWEEVEDTVWGDLNKYSGFC